MIKTKSGYVGALALSLASILLPMYFIMVFVELVISSTNNYELMLAVLLFITAIGLFGLLASLSFKLIKEQLRT